MKLAIVFGGSSFEHEISIVSAITLKNLFKKIEPIFIFIDSNREFYLVNNQDMKSNFFSSKDYLKKAKKIKIDNGGFYADSFFGNKKIDFDAVLNLVHGRDGEDGKLASMFEFFNISYIGPRVEACVLSYNKLYTKWLAKNLGVKTIEYKYLTKNDSRDLELNYPVIIKPLRLGSSIGVSVVKSKNELNYALDVAFEFDDEVLIEPFIEGIKEYNLAGCFGNNWHLSIIEEPKKEEFLDFDKKYLDFSRDSKVNAANIDDSLKEKLTEIFKTIYNPLFKGAIIRCDFFVKDNEVFLNEINPIPGSMANYLFDNFEDILIEFVKTLPKQKSINIEYLYINSIQKAKGKA
jgi:D-alanine-D-alanine ligase